MNPRDRIFLARARDPYADDLLEQEAERRAQPDWLDGHEADRRADLDAMKRGAA